ncbi:HAD family hydrolase [Candidatus Pseudothioglobus sp. Uisw_050_01]|uniref:HAD family hydrolase n=1 Tax=Candidatus Pseudothioglobus sp. Uisw_050_01 TaxID=3230997 RepID=UPI003A851384
MSEKDRVLLLDFDGVLCNGLDEMLIVSYNTYYKCDLRYVDSISSAQRIFFYQNRWMVRPAGEYFILWKAYELFKNIDIKIFHYLKLQFLEEIQLFQSSFYKQRDALKDDLEYWLSLHKTYQNVSEFLLKPESKFFIITNKDKESVEILAKYFGYFSKIRDIYSKEISVYKEQLIKRLLSDYQFDYTSNKFIFIDDNITNLDEVASMKEDIVTIFTSWGYMGDVDSEQHKKIYNMSDFIGF